MAASHTARSRALNKLARMHRDEFADLYAAERLTVGLPAEPPPPDPNGERKRRRQRDRARARRRQGLPPGDHRHGTTTGYWGHGCRCDPCLEATRDYQRRKREAS